MIEVLEPGPLCTVQDLGRPGFAALGVARSGAFDRGALRLANRLVGNPDGAAALELILGGLQLRFAASATVALTGAACAATSRCAAGCRSRRCWAPAARTRSAAWARRRCAAATCCP
jgi:allophanate hydrolase subunit 2